jgi:pimeloyl-ACP methyl ester carboxylesterase
MGRLVLAGFIAFVVTDTFAAVYSSEESWSALHYCKAAYCSTPALQNWTCGASCEFHGAFEMRRIYEQGFAGYYPPADQIVVAFRGTSSAADWVSNLVYTKVPYPNASCACKVHRGFLNEWQTISADVLADVNALVAAHPSAQVLVTGHSLAGAISMLAAVEIASITPNLLLYNFGAPRVGDSNWAAWFTSQLGGSTQFRITHKADPVVHLPPQSSGFLHAPQEVWYDNDDNISWVVCNGAATTEDAACANSVLIPAEIDDHLLYLGVCTECTCKGANVTSALSATTTPQFSVAFAVAALSLLLSWM